ncbi:PQQ-binding-like beta-propeller repeat protein [Streptomyces sp. NPDC017936]|uniref:outer membrane protein assembly factor BamB family protein n=1 Tax=Streptomyces sp. NPDC017936 TaxID=3365016 RepID=UPI00378F78E6
MSFGPPPSAYTQSALSAESQGKKRRRTLLLGLLVVALVAGLGTGAWLLWGGDGGGTKTSDKTTEAGDTGRLDVRRTVEKQPASTNGVMAFRFSVDDMSAGEHYEMPGMWATDKILAKGINKTVLGLGIGTDAAPGDERWKLALDGPICGYTRHVTGENRTAVLYRASEDEDALCDHVAFFDLDDGREIWSHDFPASTIGTSPGVPRNGAVQDTPSVTLAHDTVAVTWGGGTIAYGMDLGRTRWSTGATGACQDSGAAGGGALLVREQCWSDDKSLAADSWERITFKVRAVDPATGRALWTYSAAKGVRDLAVPSADPVVLAVSAGDTGITELLSLDGHGGNRATISLRSGTYVGECAYEEYLVVDDCPTVAVGAGQVFLRSKDQLDARTANWVIGFDLATGNSTKKFESGPDALLIPVRTSGDRLLALRESQDGITPTALVALDPETGEESPYFYFDLPAEAENFTSIDFSDVLVQDGRLFFGAKSVTGPGAGQPKWVYLALGVESGAARKK